MEQGWGTCGEMILCELFPRYRVITNDKRGVWESIAWKLNVRKVKYVGVVL